MNGPAPTPDGILTELRAALRPHGVFLRGVVNFSAGEAVPVLGDGRSAASIVLLGNVGGSLWPAFARWRQASANSKVPDPLDTWSKAVIAPVAQAVGATVYFPSDPPWQPFQRWAMRAEGLEASPLGILIHPEYGLWHGYRAALGFDRTLPVEEREPRDHPCDRCPEKPCLSTCPVNAISAAGFQVSPCRSHLATAGGQAGCMPAGCLARNACPVGRSYRYPVDQLRFHMAALSL